MSEPPLVKCPNAQKIPNAADWRRRRGNFRGAVLSDQYKKSHKEKFIFQKSDSAEN
jgi:hypothetical protein